MTTTRKSFILAAAAIVGVGAALLLHKVDTTRPPRAGKVEATAQISSDTPGPSIQRSSEANLYVLKSKTRSYENPESPDYDPLYTWNVQGTTPDILFEKEPRDPVWAPKMEEFIGGIVDSDTEKIAPEAEVVNVECRTSTCLVEIGGSQEGKDAWNAWAGSLSGQTLLSRGAPLEDGSRTLKMHLPFGEDHRELDTQKRYYDKHRRVLLELMTERGDLPEGLADEARALLDGE